MLNIIRNRLKNKDKADTLVSAILVLPVILAVLFTMLDFSIYVSNKGVIQQSARDAARSVAIFGGNGSRYSATPIEKAYGDQGACKQVENDIAQAGQDSILKKAYSSSSTPTECTLMHSIEGSNLVNVSLTSVKCDPTFTNAVGKTVNCTVQWSYDGLPGSTLALARVGKDVRTIGTASSEVKFHSNDLVGR